MRCKSGGWAAVPIVQQQHRGRSTRGWLSCALTGGGVVDVAVKVAGNESGHCRVGGEFRVDSLEEEVGAGSSSLVLGSTCPPIDIDNEQLLVVTDIGNHELETAKHDGSGDWWF